MVRELDRTQPGYRRPAGSHRPGTCARSCGSARRWRCALRDEIPLLAGLGGIALVHNPRAIKTVVSLAALYLHVRPFSNYLEGMLSSQLESLRMEESSACCALAAEAGQATPRDGFTHPRPVSDEREIEVGEARGLSVTS